MSNECVSTIESSVWQVVRHMSIINCVELANALDCDIVEANIYLYVFERDGLLRTLPQLGSSRYFSTPKGMENWRYGLIPEGYRPDVTITCEHDETMVFNAPYGAWGIRCVVCGEDLGDIDIGTI